MSRKQLDQDTYKVLILKVCHISVHEEFPTKYSAYMPVNIQGSHMNMDSVLRIACIAMYALSLNLQCLVQKLLEAEITVKLKPSLLYVLLCICPLTFITEVLHLVTTARQLKCLLLWLVPQILHLCVQYLYRVNIVFFCQVCTLHCVTEATTFKQVYY